MRKFVAGKIIAVVANPGRYVPGKIEVREFFWMAWSLLYLEPYMQTWLRQLPKDVNCATPAA